MGAELRLPTLAGVSRGVRLTDREASSTSTEEKSDLHAPMVFTPDGNRLLINEVHLSDYNVMSVPAQKGPMQPLLKSAFNEQNPTLSPDGKWIAYQSNANAAGQPEIYVRPFPERGRWYPGRSLPGGGTRPLWIGNEIFYLIQPGVMMVVPVSTKSSFTQQNPVKLFSGPYFSQLNGRTYDVARDGTAVSDGEGCWAAIGDALAFIWWKTGSKKYGGEADRTSGT